MEAEIDHLRQALNQGHYLQAGRPAGHILWQGIYRTDTEADYPELVAVLCWGGAAKRLKERDNHIGWYSLTCATFLKKPSRIDALVFILLGAECVLQGLRVDSHRRGDPHQDREMPETTRRDQSGLHEQKKAEGCK